MAMSLLGKGFESCSHEQELFVRLSVPVERSANMRRGFIKQGFVVTCRTGASQTPRFPDSQTIHRSSGSHLSVSGTP